MLPTIQPTSPTHRLPSLARLLLVVVVAFPLFAQSSHQAAAQDGPWSTPRLIFETDGTISSPIVTADEFGQVHAFWVVRPNETTDPGPNQLFYARLDQPDWQPVDIFVRDEAFGDLAAFAAAQRLSLVWQGDTYAWAGVSPAPSATEWQGPMRLHDAVGGAGAAIGPDQSIWLAYVAPTIQALYVRRFDLASRQWEEARWAANAARVQQMPGAVRMAVGADGSLHIAWTEYQLPDGWPPLGVFYSQSYDNGLTWAPPQQMTAQGYNQPNLASGRAGQVYLTYVGMAGIGGKYFTESTDGGRTWGRVEQISVAPTDGGSDGAPHILVDAVGDQHVIFTQTRCLWYTARRSGSWIWPLCLSAAVPGVVENIEMPGAALGLGNQLHVFFWFNKKQLWYMTRTLGIEGRAPLPLSTPTPPPPTAQPTATRAPTPTPTTIPIFDFDPRGAPPPKGWQQSGAGGLIFGVLPVAALLAVLLQMQIMRRRR